MAAEARRRRWTSFVAEDARDGKPVRGLNEQGNPAHRLRIEHDQVTVLIHLNDEDGKGWTTIAVDRASRRYAVAQHERQLDAAVAAVKRLRAGQPTP